MCIRDRIWDDLSCRRKWREDWWVKTLRKWEKFDYPNGTSLNGRSSPCLSPTPAYWCEDSGMGGSGSTEQKKEEASTAAENTNKVNYSQDSRVMEQVNFHPGTLGVCLSMAAMLIIILLVAYKWINRRGCFKRH